MALLLVCATAVKAQSFVTVENGKLYRDGKPYTFIGTNYWYGAILGSKGKGGNRKRLNRELDEMKRLGITNLRILVGSDGEEGIKWKASPVLQPSPGVYNDTILEGLDYLMLQLQRRGMVAVLYLNNSWDGVEAMAFTSKTLVQAKHYSLTRWDILPTLSMLRNSRPIKRRNSCFSITSISYSNAPTAIPESPTQKTLLSCLGKYVTSPVRLIRQPCPNLKRGSLRLQR